MPRVELGAGEAEFRERAPRDFVVGLRAGRKTTSEGAEVACQRGGAWQTASGGFFIFVDGSFANSCARARRPVMR